jgi:hypothetical protein
MLLVLLMLLLLLLLFWHFLFHLLMTFVELFFHFLYFCGFLSLWAFWRLAVVSSILWGLLFDFSHTLWSCF